jgi:hypothetical protein
MESIDDFGKIWLRGFMRPEYGIRIDKFYFVVGDGDPQSKDYLLYNNYLFVALYYQEKQIRVFRRLSLDLVPKSHGTLFNGFNQTKHSDIKAVTYRDEGVQQFIGSENDCVIGIDGNIDPKKLLLLTGWK